MKCIVCNNEQTAVTNSRLTKSNTQTWRRRQCKECGFTFTTHEIIDLSHLIIEKKSGKAVRYTRAKLFAGIYGATIGISIEDRELFIDKVTSEVELEIIKRRKQRITSGEIGGNRSGFTNSKVRMFE